MQAGNMQQKIHSGERTMGDVARIRPGEQPASGHLDRLLRRFAVAARAHHEALESLDEERTEAQARMVAALHGAVVREGQEGMERLLDLVDSPDPVVAGMAAVYSIRMDTVRCLAALRRVAMEPGLLGFRAVMAIERWEAGEWGE
jgi:HEAT repeat protein